MLWHGSISQGENPRILETAFLGLLGCCRRCRVLLLLALLLQDVGWTVCNQRDVCLLICVVWSSGFVLAAFLGC